MFPNMAGFPSHLLDPNEQVIFDIHPHWVKLVPAAVGAFVVVALGVVAVVVMSGSQGVGLQALVMLAAVVIAAGVFGFRYLAWTYTHFVLTESRIITRYGILAKSGIEMPVNRVNLVFFNQKFTERLLHLGDIKIESASATGATEIKGIRDPSAVQRSIYAQIEKFSSDDGALTDRPVRRGPAGNGTSTQQPSGSQPAVEQDQIPDQIKQLGRLHEDGILSDDEFASKKAELLARM